MNSETALLDRRAILSSVAGMLFGVTTASSLGAEAGTTSEGEPVFTPAGLPRSLPAAVSDRPRAMLEVAPPFDLTDRLGRTFARLKTIQNCVGRTTYLASIIRHMLCPPGQPPFAYLDELELHALYLTRPDKQTMPDADEYTVIQNGLFTRVPIHPLTFEPVREMDNPILRKSVRVMDTLFAVTGPMHLGRDALPNAILQPDRPHFRVGPDVRFVMLDIRAGQGPHQPRLDTATFSARFDELMDPRRPLINAEYSFTGLMRASVFPWTGCTADDPTQILSIKSGVKVTTVAEIPALVRDVLIARYPDRIALAKVA